MLCAVNDAPVANGGPRTDTILPISIHRSGDSRLGDGTRDIAERPSMSFRLSAIACLLASVALPASAQTISKALKAGKPILESRLRSETIEQPGLRDADALTWRNRIGFETGTFHNLKLLIEAEDVRALRDGYNSNLNGKTAYAVVADPEGTEINRLQLSWTPTKAVTVTAGRQRISLDDGRFIGNSAWRQDEQTFDALRADVKSGNWSVSYAYISKVNRTVAEAQDWDSDSHVLNIGYAVSPALKVQVFDYALDFDNAPANSTLTYGVRVSGEKAVSGAKLAYAGHYATQSDHGNNPADFELSSWAAEGSFTRGPVSLKAGYESLEGNGVRGFIMPAGTAHAFRGWADAFNTGGNKTLPDGLNDLSLGVTVTGKGWGVLKTPTLAVIHHDFDTDRLSRAVGKEWDVQATAGLTKQLSLLVKYADFQRADATMPASRSKLWFGLEYKL